MWAKHAEVVAAVLAAVGLLLAACGGASSPEVASVGSTTTTSPSSSSYASNSTYADALRYAECMRAHGDATFPDPNAEGSFNLKNPFLGSAEDSCQRVLGPAATISSADRAELLSKALKFSRCMRAHGFPEYPDPTPLAGGGIAWKSPLFLPGGGFDLHSAIVQRALKACPFIALSTTGNSATFRPGG
jgi:hypothetical protein